MYIRSHIQLYCSTSFSEASHFCDKNTRQTFHPIFELPRMREWYQGDPAPSERDLQEYAEILNEGHIRRQRAKVRYLDPTME